MVHKHGTGMMSVLDGGPILGMWNGIYYTFDDMEEYNAFTVANGPDDWHKEGN